ncbi:MAG: reverse transcriptase domain-containing protein [Candidatus Saccharimonadales bacterium]
MKVYKNLYEQIISAENIFLAWDEFRLGKNGRADVMKFEWRLEENIFNLQRQLSDKTYRHGSYHAFYITDPKQRLIHKATVRDRILHHSIFKTLNPIFEPTFITDSFSCRVDKGTHRGVKTLAKMLRQSSNNNTRTCWALKCDIYKFFASVDHAVLLTILQRKIKDERTIDLLVDIIDSFAANGQPCKGLLIGNLTSQLFANIYMNELDQFIKHDLKVKYYLRYTDDFIIVSSDKHYLGNLLPKIEDFLSSSLKLRTHPRKITIRKYISGIDFLGYVILPHYVKLRTKTKRRVLAKANHKNLPSYLGVCSHANTYKLQQELLLKTLLGVEMLE